MLYRAASSVFWFLFAPDNLLAFLALVGVAALFTRYRRGGRNLLVVVLAAYLVFGFGPAGVLLLRPLEGRFPLPPQTMPEPDGIIVLGGAVNADVTNGRGIASFSGGGRMSEAAVLALRFKNARLVFSGGPADAGAGERDEAHAARAFFARFGIAPERIVLENRSLNTEENARFSRDILHPQPNQRWLLITAAAHMPRAVGAFRHAGFEVVPYPTDYLTSGRPGEVWRIRASASRGLAV